MDTKEVEIGDEINYRHAAWQVTGIAEAGLYLRGISWSSRHEHVFVRWEHLPRRTK